MRYTRCPCRYRADAPEASAGVPPSPAKDVYALGIVLYQLACGVPPFVGSPAYLVKMHSQMAPGRPEGIPDQLWDLISKMLDKDFLNYYTMLANVKRISNYWRISEKMPKSTFLKLSDERKEKLRKTIYNMFIKKDYESISIRDLVKEMEYQ